MGSGGECSERQPRDDGRRRKKTRLEAKSGGLDERGQAASFAESERHTVSCQMCLVVCE